ncbi:MAG TPA: hypothetical protein VEF04_13065 [Blastocatellia bacterium]|nr:hypothetical protein [Blastocatellia bacterium]
MPENNKTNPLPIDEMLDQLSRQLTAMDNHSQQMFSLILAKFDKLDEQHRSLDRKIDLFIKEHISLKERVADLEENRSNLH